MIILEIVLAHLLGDFVFQSNDLIQKKYKSWRGTFEHVCIISAFTALFLFPFWRHAETWIAVGIIFATHFAQDILKVEFDLRYNQKKKSTVPFFIDQILHLSLIAYLSTFFTALEPAALSAWMEELYFSKYLVIYWIGLVLFSYAFEITLFQFARKRSRKPLVFKPNWSGMVRRMLFFSVLYGLFLMVDRSFM